MEKIVVKIEKLIILGVFALLIGATNSACSNEDNSPSDTFEDKIIILPDRDNSRFDSIYNAHNIKELEPYFNSKDIWEFRAAISRLGNLVSQELVPQKELEDAWNKQGKFSNYNREYLNSDLIRVNIAYYLLLSGESNQKLLNYLYELKGNDEYVIRYDLALAFGDVGGKEAVDILETFVKDPNQNLAKAAIKSLETRRKVLHDQYAGKVLNELLNDKNIISKGLVKEIQ